MDCGFGVICTNYSMNGKKELHLAVHGNWTDLSGFDWAAYKVFDSPEEALQYVREHSQLPPDAEYEVVRLG